MKNYLYNKDGDSIATKVLHNWQIYLDKQRRYSLHTLDCYKTDVSGFLNFLIDHKGSILTKIDLSMLSLADFRAYCAYRRRCNIQPRSIARSIAALRSYFAYARKNDYFCNNDIDMLRLPKLGRSLPKPLKLDNAINMPALIAKVNKLNNKPKWVIARDYALILMLYATGMRIAEALSVTYRDYQEMRRNQSLIITGKGKKKRIVPILPKVIDTLQQYVANCPYRFELSGKLFFGEKGGVLSPRIAQLLMQNIKNFIPEETNVTPHALRHSFASHMLANGCDLRSIQELLGHESLATTQNYTEVTDSHLLDVYKRNHPRN